MHVTSTKVQRPGNIVKGRHQHTVGMFLPQFRTDFRQFLPATLPRHFQGVNLIRILRIIRILIYYIIISINFIHIPVILLTFVNKDKHIF